MNPDFLILIFIVASMVLLAIARTHIAFIILALNTGYVLSQFLGDGVYNFFNGWIGSSEFPLVEVVHVCLIIIPALLVGIRFRYTQTGLSRHIQQIVPALALTSLAVVFILDTLPINVSDELRQESYLIGSFDSFAPILVVFAVATSLFDVFSKHASPSGHHGKRGPGRPRKH